MIETPVIKQQCKLSEYLHVLLERSKRFFTKAAFMQSSNTRGTTLCTTRLALGHSVLAYKDWPHSQGTALLQCAREAQVLEDN